MTHLSIFIEKIKERILDSGFTELKGDRKFSLIQTHWHWLSHMQLSMACSFGIQKLFLTVQPAITRIVPMIIHQVFSPLTVAVLRLDLLEIPVLPGSHRNGIQRKIQKLDARFFSVLTWERGTLMVYNSDVLWIIYLQMKAAWEILNWELGRGWQW